MVDDFTFVSRGAGIRSLRRTKQSGRRTTHFSELCSPLQKRTAGCRQREKLTALNFWRTFFTRLREAYTVRGGEHLQPQEQSWHRLGVHRLRGPVVVAKRERQLDRQNERTNEQTDAHMHTHAHRKPVGQVTIPLSGPWTMKTFAAQVVQETRSEMRMCSFATP